MRLMHPSQLHHGLFRCGAVALALGLVCLTGCTGAVADKTVGNVEADIDFAEETLFSEDFTTEAFPLLGVEADNANEDVTTPAEDFFLAVSPSIEGYTLPTEDSAQAPGSSGSNSSSGSGSSGNDSSAGSGSSGNDSSAGSGSSSGSESGKSTQYCPTEDEVYRKIMAMKDTYYEGRSWTNDNTYSWKGGIYGTLRGCAALTGILSDAGFDTLQARVIYNYDHIRVGDIIRYMNDCHEVIVLKVKSDYIVVAEGNYNEIIHWGRKIYYDELAKSFTYRITRYPD